MRLRKRAGRYGFTCRPFLHITYRRPDRRMGFEKTYFYPQKAERKAGTRNPRHKDLVTEKTVRNDRSIHSQEEHMVVNFKCPNCGASLNYSEGTQSMSCPYCNTKIDISDLAGKYDDEDGETAGEDESADGEAAGEGSAGQEEVSQFKCENCGGALITDRYTAATICPYCGSPPVIKSRISGRNKPTLLIPFNNKNQAREVFRKWVRSGLFTPRVFAKSTVLDSIIGLYVPYWLFDYEVSSHMEAAATLRKSDPG